MSSSSANLSLRPDLCDQCGRCVPACPRGQLRVGGGYIYVDASTCDGCLSCASVCSRGAISARTSSHRGAKIAVKPGEVSRVVVGSRAEAKALRKIAAEGAKAARPTARPKKAAAATTAAGAKAAKPAPRQASRAHADDTPVWTFVDALAVGAVLIAALLAKDAVLRSTLVGVMPVDRRALVRAVVLGVFYAVQVGLLAFLAHRRGRTLAEAFRLTFTGTGVSTALASVGLVAGLLVATRALSTLWGGLAQGVGWAPPSTVALTGLFGAGSVGLVLTVVMVVIVGPFVEELAFRGVLVGALDARFGFKAALLGSALAFAAYHVTPWVLVPTFVLGVALAWLALTRETLWPSIVLHALYNGVVIAAAFWLPSR